MSDPVSHLKQELLAAAERQQRHAVPARKSRRRWLERSDVRQGGRRRLVVAFAVAAVVAVAAASALAVRDFILDRGFIGVPPEGATPSTPESGELVLDFYGYSQAHGGALARVWVYADGRVIWDRRRSVPPRARTSSPRATWSNGSRPRASRCCGRRSSRAGSSIAV